MFFVSTLNYLLVNDGSGKVPAYRGLVDAVRSIVRAVWCKGIVSGWFCFQNTCTCVLSFSNSFGAGWQHSERTLIVRKGWIPNFCPPILLPIYCTCTVNERQRRLFNFLRRVGLKTL